MAINPTFFRPAGAWVGDVIPWAEADSVHLFYLYEQRVSPKPGTPWHVVTTTDGASVVERGEALPAGAFDSADFNKYTGSVVRDASGVHHLFYTGQNPARLGSDGRPVQVVMHAVSTDSMASWSTLPEHTFGAPEGYESGDWRDPFVFEDPDAEGWRMLVTARHGAGPQRRRGVIAQLWSSDLASWTLREPLWDPRRYVAHECPEVFRLGEWWYLVFSEFSDAFVTRYRMARSLEGPWLAPEHDSVDGRAFYAAKSAELDGRRQFYGWIASRERERDDGAWQWAGNLAVAEAVPRPDGTLRFRIPTALLAKFSSPANGAFPGAPDVRLDAPDSFTASIGPAPLPDEFRLSAVIDIAPGTRECGILLRTSQDGDVGYVVRLEPKRGRMVFDRWPRKQTGREQWQISGDVPYLIELERPCRLDPGVHHLEVVVSGDICVVNLDAAVMLSTRIYDHDQGRLGFFVGDGAMTLVDVAVSTRASHDEGIGKEGGEFARARLH